MTEDEQTKSAFSAPNRKDAYTKARAETPEQKGLSYTDLLVDNIIGLDNEYESFGEAFGKSFNEDELGTLKNMALSAYEGAKEFVTSPIETTKDIATEISDSVSRLGAESLDGRIKRMYGVGYQDATEEQVTKAREAVIGDAITASSLVPAAKGVTTVAKAAIPGKVQADVVGQMRSLIDGDKEFRTESKNPPVGLSAQAVLPNEKPFVPVLYRGVSNKNLSEEQKVSAREGYNLFATQNRDVAASYSGAEGEIVPIKVDASEVLEFPVETRRNPLTGTEYRNFDKLEFDRRAAQLKPGQVLVARNVQDMGPRLDTSVYAPDTEQLKSATSLTDVYAVGRGTPVAIASSNKSAQATGAAYKPRMFSSGEVGLTPSNYSVAEFYSPTVETIRNTEFPSKGYKGKELLKLLQDKTPGVRKAELSAMNLGIDPQKRYNKDEVLGLAEKRSYKVTAEVVDGDLYRASQRQDIRDPEVDYATIKINATPASDEINAFLPSRGRTHYDDNTIAHTRMSIRETPEGTEYALVEELQSDLLQHGTVKPREAITLDRAYEEVKDYVVKDITPKLKPLYDEHKEYFDTLFLSTGEKSRQYSKREKGLEISPEETEYLQSIIDKREKLLEEVAGAGGVFYQKDFQALNNYIKDSGESEGFYIDNRTRAVGETPVTETSDVVRLGLQAAMAKAGDSGVTSLVIPNVERILAADRSRPGSEEFKKYLEPNSGFQRTYTKGVEKFIKQLKEEFGDRIKIETIELPYTKQKLYYQQEELNVPNTALKIDFGDLKDVNLRVGRFAEGGMVEEDQMNRLMQEGGIADDGMTREPVTGNEIPPGSMASEVRDDIPAQLSEGEYVVPADVVRFFGVRLFEDLRKQAKQGLAEMEANGRIGGTPVNSRGVPMEGQDEELSLEEEQMLMEALGASEAGMAYGGMVQEQPISNSSPQALSTPYQDQSTLYQMPAGMGGPMGMAAGGVPVFDRTKFTLDDNSVDGGIEARKYINPTTKEVKTVNFLNGMPLGLIPEGFVPWTQEIADTPAPKPPTAPGTPTTEKKDRDGGGRDNQPVTGSTGEGSDGSWGKENYDAFTSDPYGFAVNSFNDASKNSLGFFGKTGIGGIIGDVEKVKAMGVINAALERVAPNSAQATDLQDRLDTLSGSLQSPLAGALTSVGIAGSGNVYSEQIRAEEARRGIAGAPTAAPTAGTTTTSGKPPSGSNDKPSGGGNDKPSGGGAGDSGKIGGLSFDKPSGATPGGGGGQGGPGNVGSGGGNKSVGGVGGGGGAQQGQAAGRNDSKSFGGQAASTRGGGAFAPGGLVPRKASTKKPRKGLAS